jgi:hypothetical protein
VAIDSTKKRELDGSLIQWGLKMRKLVWLLFVCSAVAMNSPASASSIFFTYSGTVSSDVTFSPISSPFVFPSVFGQNLTGQTFSISETFNLGNADHIDNGSYVGNLGNFQFASAQITIGSVSAPLNGAFGTFTPTTGGFSSEVGSKGYGLAPTFAILDYSSIFGATGLQLNGSLLLTDGGFTRTLDFNPTSETFPVSAAPLPGALPLFASALLILGIVGYVRRTKGVTPAHGQAY